LKKLLFISLAAILALSVILVGCSGEGEGEVPQYDLTLSSGLGGDVTTPTEGVHTYDEGDVVNLVATAFGDYEFVNWTGDVTDVADVNDPTTTITMNADSDIVANFEYAGADWTDELDLSLHVTMPPQASLWEYVFQPWVWEVQNETGTHGGHIMFDVTFESLPWAEDVALESVSDDVTDLGQINGEQFHLGSIGYIPFLWSMEECAYATFNLFNTQVDQWDALGELSGVKILLGTPLQPAQWWGNANVTQLSDMDGLLVRAEDPEVSTIEALGATAVPGIEAGEMAGALQTHTIDGCFFTYSGGAFAFGLKDVCSYVTEVNLFPRVYVLAMNHEVYEGLNPEARDIIDLYSTAVHSAELAADHDAAQAGAKGFIQFGPPPQIPIYVLSQSELDNWKTATAGIADDWITEMDGLGFDGQGIYDEALDLIDEYDAL